MRNRLLSTELCATQFCYKKYCIAFDLYLRFHLGLNIYMSGFWKWSKKQIVDLAPVFFFFLFSFTLLKLTESTAINQFGLTSYDISRIFIGAFIVAKAFLLLDQGQFMNYYHDRPLVYGVLWKTSFYFIGTLIFRYLEHTFTHTHEEAINIMSAPRFWVIQVWVLVLVIVYCSTRELIQKIGKEKFKTIIFG